MSVTTLAVAAAAEQAAGSQDGVRESFEVLFEGALSQHSRLLLLDEVFKGFIETNRNKGRHYMLDELLSIICTKYFFFEHLSIPYLATVYLYDGPDMDWVTIKLCNDGFQYIAKLGPMITRHNSVSWIALDPCQVMQQFPFLTSATRSRYKAAHVYYNFPEQRLDMKLYPRHEGTPGLMVTYEPGYPYMDDKAPLGDIP